MRTNFVLVDFENVQPDSMHLLDKEHFQTIVFCGANQGKMNPAFVFSVQKLGGRARYIQISGNGKNALDFHIAFYIGQLAKDVPDAYFHIISTDTGFDPLIAHLKEHKIFADRCKTIADIPLVKSANSKTPAEKLALILGRLHQMKAGKPRSINSLSSTINSLFQNTLTEADLKSLLQALQKQGFITFNDTKVSYKLPENSVQAKGL